MEQNVEELLVRKKELFFPQFDVFLTQKLNPKDEFSNLFFARKYGVNDWGFSINGLRNWKPSQDSEEGDYLQAQFNTNDIEVVGDKSLTIIPNRNRHVFTVKGINEENYLKCIEFITVRRNYLLKSVLELTDPDVPMLSYRWEQHLEQEVLKSDEC